MNCVCLDYKLDTFPNFAMDLAMTLSLTCHGGLTIIRAAD